MTETTISKACAALALALLATLTACREHGDGDGDIDADVELDADFDGDGDGDAEADADELPCREGAARCPCVGDENPIQRCIGGVWQFEGECPAEIPICYDDPQGAVCGPLEDGAPMPCE